MRKYLLLSICIVIFLSACQSESINIAIAETLVAQTQEANRPTETPVPSATYTATPTETNTPTATLTPTETPTLTPSPSPTLPASAVILEEGTIVYSGPGEGYAFLASLPAEFEIEVIGKSEDGDWLIVSVFEEAVGWVAFEAVSFNFATDTLLVYEIPAKPEATSTPLPSPVITLHTDSPIIWQSIEFFIIGLDISKSYTLRVSILESQDELEVISISPPNPDGSFSGKVRIVVPGTFVFTLYSESGEILTQNTYFIEKND